MDYIKTIKEKIFEAKGKLNIDGFNIDKDVYNIKLDDNKISFIIKLSQQFKNKAVEFERLCRNSIEKNTAKEVSIIITASSKDDIKESVLQDKRRNINGVNKIIAVASAKGGVGKSTISANLAVGFSKLGYKVALIDGDIYGPSIPKIFGVEDLKPETVGQKLLPLETHNIKLISIGNLVDSGKATIWRSPMVVKAFYQLLIGVEWGEIDIMIIDLPPGTGDIYLSLFENFNIEGIILVTTPQILAIKDVEKSINMLNIMNINIIGIIENMSYIEINGDKEYIFGKEGGKELAYNHNLNFLGEIPLDKNISKSCDQGEAFLLNNHNYFMENIINYVNNYLKKLDTPKG